MKSEPKLVMIRLGMSNRCIISGKNSIAFVELNLTSGSYSIYFVNLSIAKKMDSKPLGAFVSGPTMSSPQHEKDHDGWIHMMLRVGVLGIIMQRTCKPGTG